MGMSSQGPDGLGEIAEINVTPFVDVVLVLLVIFMIAAPAITKDILGLQLPKSSSSDQKAPVSLALAVNRNGEILLNGEPLEESTLLETLRIELQRDPNLQVIVAADGKALHERVVKAVDLAKTAGATRFAFQIEKP